MFLQLYRERVKCRGWREEFPPEPHGPGGRRQDERVEEGYDGVHLRFEPLAWSVSHGDDDFGLGICGQELAVEDCAGGVCYGLQRGVRSSTRSDQARSVHHLPCTTERKIVSFDHFERSLNSLIDSHVQANDPNPPVGKASLSLQTSPLWPPTTFQHREDSPGGQQHSDSNPHNPDRATPDAKL